MTDGLVTALGAAHQVGSRFLASGNIEIGNHVYRKVGGLNFELDIIWSTVIAGFIVLVLGLVMARRATPGVPGKLQLFFETVVDQVNHLVESTVGPSGTRIVPMAVALFLFILTANWLEVIPSAPKGSTEYLPAPTNNVNLTYAMALVAIIIVHAASIRARGLRGYFRHYTRPFMVFLPINIIEEITKPVTLALRLFGNLFAGTLMLLLIAALLPVYIVPFGDILWKLFDMFIGFIQAFIFALLFIVYYGMATSVEEAH
ncbi:MAG TPA: ATP synthase F0 subunit A [Acidimicrobiaceae bacterium]|nr:ATP synthase F0 subunit A [Acidimicrobiaceae bacterium]